MKKTIFSLVICLLMLTTIARASVIKVTKATGTVIQKIRIVRVYFDQDIPKDEILEHQVTSLQNYVVTEDATTPNGANGSAVSKALVITRAQFLKIQGVERRNCIVLELASPGYGEGSVKVRTINLKGAVAIEGNTVRWDIDTIPSISGTSGDFNLQFPNETLVANFSYAYTTNYRFSKSTKKASQQMFNLEGSVPLIEPSDTKWGKANTDASGTVADFVQASFTQRTYTRANNLWSYGATVRTSGRFNGIEVVGRLQPYATLFNQGRNFFGAELEAGYRDGKSEWINLTQKAPDRGNTVARLGTVFEWAPQLGPINRDLGTGLRFFVRGRGWMDFAKNNSGKDDVRFRGFLDSEIFYNVNTKYRAFVRYELGSLPPDLSRSVNHIFFGIGGSF